MWFNSIEKLNQIALTDLGMNKRIDNQDPHESCLSMHGHGTSPTLMSNVNYVGPPTTARDHGVSFDLAHLGITRTRGAAGLDEALSVWA